MRATTLLGLSALLASATAHAGGFAVGEQDASATGRAGIGIPASASPTAVYFNPAGLAGIRGPAVSAGATVIFPSVTAIDPATQHEDSAAFAAKVPPHVYGAYGIDRFGFGVGFNAPFGGGLSWAEDWRGRYELTAMSLQVLAGHLAGAYAISDDLSAGLALQLYSASVEQTKHVDFVSGDGTALVGASGAGVGAGLGVSWHTPFHLPSADRLRVAASGNLPSTTMHVSGRVHFSDVPPAFANLLPDQAITSSLQLPGKVGFGFELPMPTTGESFWQGLRVYGEAQATFWSAFRTFDVDFENPETPDVHQLKDWGLAPTFRLGGEMELAQTTVRLGALFDGAASPASTLSPSLPDSSRVGVSLGAGRNLGPVHGDLAYMFVLFVPRASEGEAFPADYRASANMVALTVSWRNAGE